MKRFFRFSTAGLVAAIAVTAAAGSLTLEQVNEKVAGLLAAFNNEATTARLVFAAMETDPERVVKFGVESLFTKVGPENSVRLQLPRFTYEYNGPQGLPHFEAGLGLELDMLKAFPRQYLDDLAQGAEDIVKDSVAGLIEEYGGAATIDAKVDELLRDAENHVTSVKMHVEFAIDMTRLPETVKIEDVYLLNARLEAAVGLQGGSLSVSGNVNPQHTSFRVDQRGLKEVVDALLNEDKETYEQLGEFARMLDNMAEKLVTKRAEEGHR
jgi:hypothetical protein